MSIPFVAAKHFRTANRGKGDIRLIVVHDMEMKEAGTTAESCADYFARRITRPASAHYTVDSNSIVQCVREKDIAFHAPPNSHSIGIEHAGFARQSRAEWLDAFGVAMLTRSAQLVAALCRKYDIPVRRLTVAQLKNGERGICGHIDISNAFHQTDHSDPGPHFPWDWYLARVKEFYAGTAAAPSPPAETVRTTVPGSSRPLARGDSGAAVRTLQRKLNAAGAKLKVDGQFGPATEKALKIVQARCGLTTDGVYGPKSAAALDAVIAHKTPAWKKTAAAVAAALATGTAAVGGHATAPSTAPAPRPTVTATPTRTVTTKPTTKPVAAPTPSRTVTSTPELPSASPTALPTAKPGPALTYTVTLGECRVVLTPKG